MRFRLIEKDMGGMANVGLDQQHIQGKEDDVTTSDSKTYIGSNGKKKVAMNKIKNTKIGDDIHYYINGKEGRGIIIKMGNEFIEVFGDDRKVNNIHINDTFFVKDILINKQWDDMDNTERYEALIKIHAPSPRYITKTWFDMPEEIKVLLQKEGGNMAGGTGSTYEEGESKDSETKDHTRTGFAQNAQYAKKAKKKRWIDPETGVEDATEHSYRYERELATEKFKDTMKPEEHEGHPDYYNKEKNPFWNKRVETDPNKLDSKGIPYGKGHHKVYHPDDPVSDHTRRKGHRDNFVRAGGEALGRRTRKNAQNVHTGEADDEIKYKNYQKRRAGYDKAKKVVTEAEQPNAKPERQTIQEIYQYKQPKSEHPVQDKLDREASKKPATDEEQDKGLKDLGLEKSFYKQWLTKKKPRPSPRTAHGSFGTTQSEAGQEAQANTRSATTSAAGALGIDFGTATKAELDAVLTGKYDAYKSEQFRKIYGGKKGKKKSEEAEHGRNVRDNIKRRDGQEAIKVHRVKSDIETGTYGNASGSSDVGVSTNTPLDVTEETGYEERPHISVEDADKLPRRTFQTGNETNVRGGSNEGNEPHKVTRKKGIPEQHPNTYGMRYGMKGGVKKVWCPEHQMWEETRKDWHEDK